MGLKSLPKGPNDQKRGIKHYSLQSELESIFRKPIVEDDIDSEDEQNLATGTDNNGRASSV